MLYCSFDKFLPCLVSLFYTRVYVQFRCSTRVTSFVFLYACLVLFLYTRVQFRFSTCVSSFVFLIRVQFRFSTSCLVSFFYLASSFVFLHRVLFRFSSSLYIFLFVHACLISFFFTLVQLRFSTSVSSFVFLHACLVLFFYKLVQFRFSISLSSLIFQLGSLVSFSYIIVGFVFLHPVQFCFSTSCLVQSLVSSFAFPVYPSRNRVCKSLDYAVIILIFQFPVLLQAIVALMSVGKDFGRYFRLYLRCCFPFVELSCHILCQLTLQHSSSTTNNIGTLGKKRLLHLTSFRETRPDHGFNT